MVLLHENLLLWEAKQHAAALALPLIRPLFSEITNFDASEMESCQRTNTFRVALVGFCKVGTEMSRFADNF